MPTTTDEDQEIGAASSTVLLEFNTRPDSSFFLFQFIETLEALQEMVRTLESVDDTFRSSTLPVVLELEMHSPFRIRLGLAGATKAVVKGFVSLCRTLTFLPEEKERRRALAAGEWEDVYAKRLKNIKTVVEIVSKSGSNPSRARLDDVDRLMKSIATVQNGPLQLTKVEDQEDDSPEDSEEK